MNSYNLERWKELLSLIKLDGKLNPSNLEDISKYEKQSNFILPRAYKEYCLVFGTGYYKHNSFSIDAPPWLLLGDLDRIEACKNAHDYPNEILELLDSAHVFGTASGFVFFFFDNRSYSDKDESYDIYGIGDRLTSVYKLTRDFFEFVRDYCIGTKAENFPDIFVDIPSNSIETLKYQNKTFSVD